MSVQRSPVSRVLAVAAVAVMVVVTVVLQVSVFDAFAIQGVAPDFALLLVVGAALVRGPAYGAGVGFVAGLVLDLAPPADHTAGRWALAFVIVGALVGTVRPQGRLGIVHTLVAVACAAFIATSVFAITGLVIGGQSVTLAAATHVVPIAVLYDLLLAPLVMPLAFLAFRRIDSLGRW